MKAGFLILLFLLYNGYCLDTCEKQLTCEGCITDPNYCVWCALDHLNGSRCKNIKRVEKDWCIGNIINPNSSVIVEGNQNFSSNFGNIIQLKPQMIKLNLRPGKKESFEFSFKLAKDYPVDLYFLLDGSYSMKDIKEETSKESRKIYKTLKSMTNNVYLGLGSFVDKNTLPYTQTINSTLTYSFKNRLILTENINEFQHALDTKDLGSNYDPQEGGLDALAQVIVCKDMIGWRAESRKIIILLTNGPYHTAGDGKYGGIFRPYDGKCYSQNGTYTHELELDYPSLSMISKLAAEEQITTIFAFHENVNNVYKPLEEVVSGAKATKYKDGEMSKILSSIYRDLTSYINIGVNMLPEFRNSIQISFEPDCFSKKNNANECKVKQGEEKRIKGNIKILKHFTGENKTINLTIEGIKEKIKLDINIIESCECKREENSKMCSGRGTRRCGICECLKGSIGDTCQCQGNDISAFSNRTCISPESNKICNGAGDCICGSCVCKERYAGQYCECNQDSCPRGKNGLICSELGDCDCGNCRCKEGWSGEDCSCSTSQDTCSDGKNICNNRGDCVCGSCQCEPIPSWDSRTSQDEKCVISSCSSCHAPQCHLLEPCVICKYKNTSCSSCHHLNITIKNNITENWSKCPDVSVDIGCYTSYMYKYSEEQNGIDVIVEKDMNCAESYYALGGIIIGVLILIGVISLVAWKSIIQYRDRREYEQFKKELSENDTFENPIFESAVTTFNNPAFRRKSTTQ